MSEIDPAIQKGNFMKAKATVSTVALCAFAAGTLHAQNSGASWKEYLGGPDSSHFSPAMQITPANVNKLDVAWSYSTGDNGTYVAAKQGALVALDATTGKELWAHTFPAPEGGGGGGRIGLDGFAGNE